MPLLQKDEGKRLRNGDLRYLERLDYEETAEPWILPDTPLVLHRFLKVEGQDEIMIAIFLTSDDEHLRIIEDAAPASSKL
jgi:hypothetical protein